MMSAKVAGSPLVHSRGHCLSGREDNHIGKLLIGALQDIRACFFSHPDVGQKAIQDRGAGPIASSSHLKSQQLRILSSKRGGTAKVRDRNLPPEPGRP